MAVFGCFSDFKNAIYSIKSAFLALSLDIDKFLDFNPNHLVFLSHIICLTQWGKTIYLQSV